MERKYVGLMCVSVDREAEVMVLEWTDVLRSLELSYDLLCATAEEVNAGATERDPEGTLAELEARLDRIGSRRR